MVKINRKWAVVTCLMALLIWGNSLVPGSGSIDETIQLFVPGRAGMITDVMIDCCGAATGVVLRYLLRSLMCAKKAA